MLENLGRWIAATARVSVEKGRKQSSPKVAAAFEEKVLWGVLTGSTRAFDSTGAKHIVWQIALCGTMQAGAYLGIVPLESSDGRTRQWFDWPQRLCLMQH